MSTALHLTGKNVIEGATFVDNVIYIDKITADKIKNSKMIDCHVCYLVINRQLTKEDFDDVIKVFRNNTFINNDPNYKNPFFFRSCDENELSSLDPYFYPFTTYSKTTPEEMYQKFLELCDELNTDAITFAKFMRYRSKYFNTQIDN